MPVSKAKKKIKGMEFLRWQLKILLDEEDVIKKEWERRTRMDYYLAQAAAEISSLHRSVVSIFTKPNWPALNTENFLIKFTYGDGEDQNGNAKTAAALPPKKTKTIDEMTPEEIAAKKKEVSQRSRAAWGVALGLNPERDA